MGSHFRTLTLPLLTVASLATCTRDRVDLGDGRPCSTDADCLDGYVCNSGLCSKTGGETCTPTTEVCDGRDNDCNDLVDESFPCAVGDRETCTAEPGERFCLSNCSYSSCTVGWFDGRWAQRLPVTIPAGTVTEAMTDLPVPLRFSDTIFTTAGIDPAALLPGGRDVRVTTADGTLLPHQIEAWGASTYLLWVRIPTIDPTTAVSLYLYLNNPSAEDASTTDVWDSGYAGVWHLADPEAATELADATSAAHAAIGRLASPETGVFANGQAYDGVIGARAADVTLTANASFTLEGWFSPKGSAFPYRRSLNVDVPVDDMEVWWPIPDDDNFRLRTGGGYQSIRILDDAATMIPFGILYDGSAYDFWTRAATAGPHSFTLLYGNPSATDESHPENVFHFWAFQDSWDQFEPAPSATSYRPYALTVTSGRLATQLPVDLRDGYFVRSYVGYNQQVAETRDSGGLPTIASTPDLTTDLTTAASVVHVFHDPGATTGGLLTSDGIEAGFDQGSSLPLLSLLGSIGIGIDNNQVSVFAGNSLVQTATSTWQDPLTYLLLGAYDAVSSFYPTAYVAMLVRRWPGVDAIATATRERVGGLAIGNFGIGANSNAVFISTNLGVAFIDQSSSDRSSHHVALVIDGLYSTLYVDGESVAEGPVDPRDALTGLAIGDPYSFRGVLDEVRLSSVARSVGYVQFQARSERDDLIGVGAVETLR